MESEMTQYEMVPAIMAVAGALWVIVTLRRIGR